MKSLVVAVAMFLLLNIWSCTAVLSELQIPAAPSEEEIEELERDLEVFLPESQQEMLCMPSSFEETMWK